MEETFEQMLHRLQYERGKGSANKMKEAILNSASPSSALPTKEKYVRKESLVIIENDKGYVCSGCGKLFTSKDLEPYEDKNEPSWCLASNSHCPSCNVLWDGFCGDV